MEIRFKEEKVVAKLHNEDGSHKMSINIPSAYWPLNGTKYEKFQFNDCALAEDETILEAFDATKYQIGRCYSNSEHLAQNLRERGVDAKIYVGWLFIEKNGVPIHHCWVVVNGSVLDLADDYYVQMANAEQFDKAKNNDERMELIADFQKWARQFPNSKRCMPVGRPTPGLLYIGCPCDPRMGRMIYNNLIDKYPDHVCNSNCDATGMNATQRVMARHGLMD